MRRVFISILVLGVSTWAGADLLFNVNGMDVADGGTMEIPVGTVFELQVINDTETGLIGLGGFCFLPDHVEIVGDPVVYNENLPGTWIVEDYGIDEYGLFKNFYWYLFIQTVPAVGKTLVGPLFGITLRCTEEGPVPVKIADLSYEYAFASMTINQVPEPASLALLAAGTLLIRKRNAKIGRRKIEDSSNI
jgi:hypothetical protein